MRFYMSLLCLCAGLTVGATHGFAAEGAGSSGGGDPFYNLFVRAKGNVTTTILKTTKPEWMVGASAEVVDFFKANQQAMINDLAASPIEMRPTNDNGRCGETGLTPQSTIYISKQQCGDFTHMDLTSASEMLIGETTHHFGKQNEFAAMVAVAVMDGYRRGWATAQHDISVRDQLVGQFVGSFDDSGKEEAMRRYDSACEAWLNEFKQDLGDQLTYANCEPAKLYRYVMNSLDGEISVIGGDEPVLPQLSQVSLGFEAWGTGHGIYSVSGPTRNFDDNVSNSQISYSRTDKVAFVNARYKVIQDFHRGCDTWKAGLRKSFGARFVRAACIYNHSKYDLQQGFGIMTFQGAGTATILAQ